MASVELWKWLAKEVVVAPSVVSGGNHVLKVLEDLFILKVEKGLDQEKELVLGKDSLNVAEETLHDILILLVIIQERS